MRYFWVKPSDVSIYVERGAADIGVAGKDILLEYAPDVYELLDLKLGKCSMCVAAKKGFVYGIPVGILSGGEYDGLLKKMQKNEKGIGFAVYLDELSRLGEAKGATE